MNLFLLAAGEGTRFRPHTQILPKPALPFCGVPLIYYSFYLAKCLRPEQVVINTYHLPLKMHQVGKKLEAFGVEVHFSDEQELLLGSAGGMAKAREKLIGRGGFVAMNADEVIIPKQVAVMRQFHDSAKASSSLATLMVMKHPEAGKKFGAVWATPSGKVLGFGKTKPESQEELIPYHFIGPMYFHDKIFERLSVEPSNILHDTLKKAIAEGESVGIFPIECEWYETGNLEDYLRATESVLQLLQRKNPFLLAMQRELSLGMKLQQKGSLTLLTHETAEIPSNPQLEGWIVAGPHSKISNTCHLKNVVLAEGIEITTNQSHTEALLLG